MGKTRSLAPFLLAATLLPALCPAAHAQTDLTLIPLGIPSGYDRSVATAVSQDGSVAVGVSFLASAPSTSQQAFRWKDGVLTGLGTLPGHAMSIASGVSADGQVVVGSSQATPTTGQAFRWQGGVMTGLGKLSRHQDSYAHGISADGTRIVGYGFNFGVEGEAYHWWNGSVTGLGDLPGGFVDSLARAISADGSTIVGYASIPDSLVAVRWQNGNMTSLGDLPGGSVMSEAYAVSADGSVIVGQSTSDKGGEAFRWQNGVMVGLGDLPSSSSGPYNSTGHGVSADGSVVVGDANGGGFLWRADMGMVSLRDLSAALYATGIDGTQLSQIEVRGISGDGTTIAGEYVSANGRFACLLRATNPGGFITLPTPHFVSGRLQLQGYAGASARNLRVELREVGGAGRVVQFRRWGWAAAERQGFSLPALPGQYVLAVKGPNCLQVAIPIDLRNGNVDNVDFVLPAGDINNDNRVNLTDLVLLRSNYGKTGSISMAGDLTGDGKVNLSDLVLLRSNYGEQGDL